MDPIENTSASTHDVTPSKWLTPRNLSVSIIGIQVLLSIVTYPFMPAQVPSHWGFSGEVNGYMPKLWSAILFPALSIVLYVLMRGLLALGSNVSGAENQRLSRKLADQFLVVLLLFILVLQGTITAFAFGYPVDMLAIVNVAAALLFIVLGNYLGKVPRNFWMGIRTPWTLASDFVWERTHRLGSWLFVLAGLLTFFLNFITPLRALAVLVPAITVSVVLVIYSYVCFQRLAKSGQNPLSPPFS